MVAVVTVGVIIIVVVVAVVAIALALVVVSVFVILTLIEKDADPACHLNKLARMQLGTDKKEHGLNRPPK